MAASFPAISIVVPTFNEAHNVPKLVGLLDKALGKIAWEAIFVDDDSPDGTWRVAKQLAGGDPRVRCIRRVGRRVLSSAAPYVAVMDADLQHDESILPDMLAMLQKDEADIVIGSRYIDGQAGTTGLSARRAFASRFAARLADFVVGNHVSDPMTGFFAMKREVFETSAERLLPSGFKILLDLLASVERPIRIAEVGYRFRSRQQGQSKFDMRAMMDFLALLLHRWTGGLVPVRFLFFAAVGTVGVGVHLTALRIGLDVLHLSFEWSQALATLCAMTSNFAINNLFTYRDMMLRGAAALTGLLRFYAVCSIGVIANVGVASYLFESDRTWWVASLAGIVVGTAFNYMMSSIFIWGRRL
jgi:dolichol-phosphate mannosyltransferase